MRSSPNKSCSEDNLERVIDMQHYNPLIHQHFGESLLNDTGCNSTTEEPQGKANRVVLSSCENGNVLGEEPRNMVQ